MSSTAVVSGNVNGSSIGQQKPAAFCSSINTTAKSTATTVTSASSAKKSSRKSDTESTTNGTNFLPIAPNQAFYSHSNHIHHSHQGGIALASVQQQQSLQSSGVAVFSSPNMMTTQQQGPQTAQLVVNAQGQHVQTFNNGQGIIQTGPGMGMIQGLPQMQMIQTGPGQPTYTMPISQFQYGHNMSHMQPIILAPSMFQQSPSQLAIQIPNGNNANTMITNQITTNAANTPVKPGQQQGQTIIKSVSMSPQQPQATKSSAATTPTAVRGQALPNQQQQQQQTIIGTPTFQTTGTPNQTFVIGTFQSQPNGQANGATIISTPNNNRKNNTSGANIIHQKIQPATSLATTPMIAPAQFKTNNSPFQTAQNGGSPGSAQTIMVHNQGLQSGTGGLQLATNPTIISSFNPGITWTTGAINQPQTQLVAPNGQPIFFRSQSADGQPQMFIQTGNNQFQALPMQMTQGTPQQANTTGTMQMAAGHQQMVASSVNQTMPLIQATTNHQTVAHASNMMQQPQQTTGTAMTGGMSHSVNHINHMTQATVVSQSISTPTSAPMANSPRQRPIRPASNNSSSSAGKQKVSLDSRSNVSNASPIGMQAKLAPKIGPVASAGIPNSTTPVRPGSLGTQQGKIPLTMTKASDGTTPNVKNAPVGSTGSANNSPFNSANNSGANKIGQKVGTFTPPSSAPGTVMTPSSLNVSASGTMMTNSSSTLVNSALNPLNRSTSPASSLNKVNRKIEKKDSSTGTPTFVTKPIKSGLNGVRTSTGFTNKSVAPNASSSSQLASQNTQMINGVLCQVPANPQVKATTTNQKTSNGTSSKSVGIGVQKGLSTPKPKPKQPENVVLTHVIDGYVIQESPSPFPINGHSSEAEKDKDSLAEDAKQVKSESGKENSAVNKDSSTSTVSNTTNGIKVEAQQTATSTSATSTGTFANNKQSRVNVGCVNCGKKEMFKNGKDKMKKYCSAACNEAFAQKKALQNGTAPMAPPAPVMNKVMGQPLMANSIMPPMPSMPMAAMPLLQPTAQQIITSISIPMPVMNSNTVMQMNGGGLKRSNNKETNGPAPEKKARVNSPLTVKNDAQMANNKAAQQNGLANAAGTADTLSSTLKEDKADMPELEGIWLPGGGKDPPTKWSVQDVYDFINNLEGCSGCADEFRTHEIDGQALMFINEEHIITILKMKLGPALKICRKIKDLKSAFNM